MVLQVLRRRFTVYEYHQMARSGILKASDRVELLEGEIIEMAPIDSRHAACVRRLVQMFSALGQQQAILDVQNPVRLNEHSEPQPDLALLRPEPGFYSSRHPEPDQVFLLVEVSDTSFVYDREIKLPLYARAGIAEVWLVDLPGERIEIYREPRPDGYHQIRIATREDTLAPAAFPDIKLNAGDILGPAP